MPKKKTYEFDYEWNGNSQPQKGVNIKAKNPWPTPTFASVKSGNKSSSVRISHTPVQAPTNLTELRQSHPWEKPQWATLDTNPRKQTTTTTTTAHDDEENVGIDRNAIPKPMLKKTPGMTTCNNNNNSDGIHADSEDAIAVMERKLAAAKQRKAELLLLQTKQAHTVSAIHQDTNVDTTTLNDRTKHVLEETTLERARRLAKERENERWRATLQERNERDKTKRTNAFLASKHIREDTAWQQKPKPTPTDKDDHDHGSMEETTRNDAGTTTIIALNEPPVVVQSSVAVTSPIAVDEEPSSLPVHPTRLASSLAVPNPYPTTSLVYQEKPTRSNSSSNGSKVMMVVTQTTQQPMDHLYDEEDDPAAELARQIAQLELELQQYP